MPPKVDPNRIDYITLKCVGGEPSVASSLGPKLGAFGVPPKKVAEEIANQTKSAKGSKVTVQLKIQNRQATVTLIETSSYLIMRALKTPIRDRKKQKNIQHNGNLTFDQVVEIARKMSHKSMAKELKGTVKEILGTCQSIGCNVEGSTPREVIKQINEGELVK